MKNPYTTFLSHPPRLFTEYSLIARIDPSCDTHFSGQPWRIGWSSKTEWKWRQRIKKTLIIGKGLKEIRWVTRWWIVRANSPFERNWTRLPRTRHSRSCLQQTYKWDRAQGLPSGWWPPKTSSCHVEGGKPRGENQRNSESFVSSRLDIESLNVHT